MNIKKSKQNNEDEELLHLTKILSQIHKEYFSIPENNIIDILKNKKKIFTGLNFYIYNSKLKKKIEDFDGVVVETLAEANYVIISKNLELDLTSLKADHCVVVDENYIFDSVYKLRKVNVEKYVLYDFSGDDQLINEIFDDL
ncbi:RNA polymerase II subunit A C-terminal domain phosphatase [Vairimorpha necatrix]|uniref:RNA polymerase II subunit A C-terminal domain phosphatase n=1 Tax=Vairimorpha necatrix TaxID=6039 RepID=A0AAX4JAQ6_9MICR